MSALISARDWRVRCMATCVSSRENRTCSTAARVFKRTCGRAAIQPRCERALFVSSQAPYYPPFYLVVSSASRSWSDTLFRFRPAYRRDVFLSIYDRFGVKSGRCSFCRVVRFGGVNEHRLVSELANQLQTTRHCRTLSSTGSHHRSQNSELKRTLRYCLARANMRILELEKPLYG